MRIFWTLFQFIAFAVVLSLPSLAQAFDYGKADFHCAQFYDRDNSESVDWVRWCDEAQQKIGQHGDACELWCMKRLNPLLVPWCTTNCIFAEESEGAKKKEGLATRILGLASTAAEHTDLHVGFRDGELKVGVEFHSKKKSESPPESESRFPWYVSVFVGVVLVFGLVSLVASRRRRRRRYPRSTSSPRRSYHSPDDVGGSDLVDAALVAHEYDAGPDLGDAISGVADAVGSVAGAVGEALSDIDLDL